jgi:L-2-hydroxyglutarate oxidase LhgO
MERVSVTIIGGGVIGCAIAQELSKTAVRDILLIERNPKIEGDNQSSRNSGVIHAGIYYSRTTEPFKARFCVEGNRLLYEFCEEFGVPHRRTGKLVVAVDDLEAEYLDEVRTDAAANGVLSRKIGGKTAVVLRPCEMRAVVELIKLKQVQPDNLIFIGIL